MITILKIDRHTNEIDGWIHADNFNHAARIASSSGNSALANYCYANEWNLDNNSSARFDLPVYDGTQFKYTVLQ